MSVTEREQLETALIAALEVAIHADRRMEEAQDKSQHFIHRMRLALAQLGALERVVVPKPFFPVQDARKEYEVIPSADRFDEVANDALRDWGLLDIVDANGVKWRAQVVVVFDVAEPPRLANTNTWGTEREAVTK